jgi:hypothetical protein
MTIPGLLTDAEQHAAWSLLLRGAAPTVVCRELGLSVKALWHTLLNDAGFGSAVQQMYDTQSHNVVAALYKLAIDGNFSAQRFWLECRPAELWSRNVNPQADAHAHLSDEELAEELRATGAAISAARGRDATL